MFSKETTKKVSTGSAAPAINIISEGTRIEGDIHSDNDIRVSGSIKGEANSKGRIIITSTGLIAGNVRAKDADIAGKLDGELFIVDKLVLRQSAVINGDIHTKSLLVEEGAEISGNCKMGLDSNSDSKANGDGVGQNKVLKEKTA